MILHNCSAIASVNFIGNFLFVFSFVFRVSLDFFFKKQIIYEVFQKKNYNYEVHHSLLFIFKIKIIYYYFLGNYLSFKGW